MKRMNKKSRIIILLTLSVCFLIIVVLGKTLTGNAVTSKASEQKNGIATRSHSQDNITMFQGYEWNTDRDGNHWNEIGSMATKFKNLGINQVWLPPAYKGWHGMDDTGYSPYDLYDLGEFSGNRPDNSWETETRYGSKDEYLNAIRQLKANGIKVYADIVLNHKSGGEAKETVRATEYDENYRVTGKKGTRDIEVYSVFNFNVGPKPRNNTYSSFKWNASCFKAADWDAKLLTDSYDYNKDKNSVYLFEGKKWDANVDPENENYDYLNDLDIDFSAPYVREELKRWGEWYVNTTGIDGVRLDAVKHVDYKFYNEWVEDVERRTGKDLGVVAEYLDGDINEINKYIKKTEGKTDVFDFPLWFKLRDASKGNFDLTKLFNESLAERNQELGVMFVDNHDTQVGKEEQKNTVQQWFKAPAYAAILTRQGKSCVFYGDYYGTNPIEDGHPGTCNSIRNELEPLLYARKNYAYGEQVNYFDDPDCIGWVRKGDSVHAGSGLATLITDSYSDKYKYMNVGAQHAGEVWYDITGDVKETVTIDRNGGATFKVKGRNNGKCYSVWVRDNSKTKNNMGESKIRNQIKVYYKGDIENVHIMYGSHEYDWTALPGIKMTDSVYDEYKEITIPIEDNKSLQICFTDGKGNWENNNKHNYTVYSPGEYTVLYGTLIRDNPKI